MPKFKPKHFIAWLQEISGQSRLSKPDYLMTAATMGNLCGFMARNQWAHTIPVLWFNNEDRGVRFMEPDASDIEIPFAVCMLDFTVPGEGREMRLEPMPISTPVDTQGRMFAFIDGARTMGAGLRIRRPKCEIWEIESGASSGLITLALAEISDGHARALARGELPAPLALAAANRGFHVSSRWSDVSAFRDAWRDHV